MTSILLVISLLFQPAANYAELVLNSCLANYRCNTKPASSVGFDYVSGLVMKATIEAVQAQPERPDAAAWYRAVRDYGNAYYNTIPGQPKDLDILNACKLYFALREEASSGRWGSDSATVRHCDEALRAAAQALAYYDRTYAISDSVSMAYSGTSFYTGGWWHKSKYINEMWCDGQYMGPALLAQLLVHGYVPEGRTEAEWWQVVMRQFDISWFALWSPEECLLRHAFSASPQSDPWAEQDRESAFYGVSAEYWGRAVGWYLLALVDVLEAIQQAPDSLQPALALSSARLSFYLRQLASGIVSHQDVTSGCWTQLLQYPVGYMAEGCDRANYLESSASALFTAGLFKAVRLGFLPHDVYLSSAERAYRGCVERFLVENVGDGNPVALIDGCASAGLSDTRMGDAAYYLCGKDVTRVTSYTEGKVLGAFLLATTEYLLSKH